MLSLFLACGSGPPTTSTVDSDVSTSAGEIESPSADQDEDVDGDGWRVADGDCDDSDAAIHPGADEQCNNVDDDCNGEIDDALETMSAYVDSDGDGYGDPDTETVGCALPAGTISDGTDCDDSDAAVHPGAAETSSNDIDDDCDGEAWAQGAVSVIADCAINSYARATDNKTRTRVLAVYGSIDDGPIAVHVEPSEPVSLVLSAYDAPAWTITEATPGTIQEIIISSCDGLDVSVDAPPTASVSFYTWKDGIHPLSDCGYYWDDTETRELVTAAEELLGTELDSFHGCNEASSLTVTEASAFEDFSVYPDCDGSEVSTGPSAGPDVSVLSSISGCKAVLKESGYCLTTTGSQIQLLGMDTASTCQVTASAVESWSLAWLDEHLYACESEHDMLVRIDLTSGEIDKTYVYCDGVTSWKGRLLIDPDHYDPVLDESTDHLFDSFVDAQCIGPSQALGGTTDRQRIVATDDTLYAASHSAESVGSYPLPEIGSTSTLIYPEDFDGWVYGLATLGADKLVINASNDGEYRIYDISSGELLDTIAAPTLTYGLVCAEN